MKTTTVEVQSKRILELPLILMSASLVVMVLITIGFQVDLLHIVIAVLLVGLSCIIARWMAKILSQRLAHHVGSSLELLRTQIEGTIYDSRDFEFHSDLTEAMSIAHSVQMLHARVVEVRHEMKVLEQVRSQFLANVSHEIRTPIFAIQGYLETLLEGAENDERVRHTFIEKANSNAKRLNVLLGDLIDISRIESGEMRMSFRYFNIVDVARDVCSSLEGLASQFSVSLNVHSDDQEVLSLGDKERIIQVLSNLVSNAIRYNRSGGRVDVHIEKGDGGVKVSVADTGIGISPEHQQRIFERFYRAETHRSRSTGGSGLGLAIVKHILEAHETTPEIQSEENVGSTMSFTLKS